MSFLHCKLYNWYDKYINVVNDMYEENVLDDEDIDIFSKNNDEM